MPASVCAAGMTFSVCRHESANEARQPGSRLAPRLGRIGCPANLLPAGLPTAPTPRVRGAEQIVKVSLSPDCAELRLHRLFLAGGLDDDHGMSQARRAHRENS